MREMMHNSCDEVYIKYFITLILSLTLVVPMRSTAIEVDSQATIVQHDQIVLNLEEQSRLQEAKRQDELSKNLTRKAESLIGSRQGQCVVAVRKFLGVGRSEVQGSAKNTRVNSKVPVVGSIIVFYGTKKSPHGHVGIVLFTTSDNNVYYYSPNSTGSKSVSGGPTKIDKVKIDSKSIKGYRVTAEIRIN